MDPIIVRADSAKPATAEDVFREGFTLFTRAMLRELTKGTDLEGVTPPKKVVDFYVDAMMGEFLDRGGTLFTLWDRAVKLKNFEKTKETKEEDQQ